MANDKKFIVKNGLLSPTGSVVVGSTSFNSTDELQVTGSSLFTGSATFTQSNSSLASLQIFNTGGHAANSIVAEFKGDSDSLSIVNFSAGAYELINPGQNNGIRFYDGTDGVDVVYNGITDLEFSSTGIDFKREPSYLGNVFWNAGNDGAGSGLDADVLDGLESTQFVRSDQSDTMDGDYVITGNLTVQGTTTQIDTVELLISDNIITLNSDFTTGTPTENAGIEISRGDASDSSLIWDENNVWWKLISNGSDLGRIITTADEGSGNGFDADSVDGLEANQFLRSDADDTTTGNLTVEGDLTVGDGAGTATIKLDAAGGVESIAALNGEIGFLGSDFNFAIKVKTNNDVEVANDILAERFVDVDATDYYAHPGDISVLNGIDLEGKIRHNGDTDTWINFNATDQFEVFTGNSRRLLVTNTKVEAINRMDAPVFYDSGDDTYYGDFASTSRLNDISLVGQIIHDGDTNTYLDFNTADSFQVVTGGTAKLTVANSAVTSSVDLVAPRLVDSDDNSFVMNPSGLSSLHSANFYSGAATNDVNIGLNSNERLNFNVTDGQGYIRYYQDETDATDHSLNFEIQSSGIGLNRFNFNADINIGNNGFIGGTSQVDSAYASKYYDLDDETYYADFANTTTSLFFNSRSLGGNGSQSDPTYSFRGDTDTGMYRSGTNTLAFTAGNNLEFRVFTTYTQSEGDIRAPRFVDRNDTNYYADPAGDSQMNTIDLDDYIRHRGDTNTLFGFSANDTVVVDTNGTRRLTISNSAITGTVNMVAPRFVDSSNANYYGDFASTSQMNRIDIDDYIRHSGDTNTYFGFQANDTFRVFTNGTQRLNLDGDSADFAQNVYAPQYFTNDYLIHNGDTDTYIGFDAADNFGVWTGGTERLSVDNDSVDISVNTSVTGSVTGTGRGVFGNSLTRPDDLSDLSNSALRAGGSDVHLHVASLSATGNYTVALQSGRESDDTTFPMSVQAEGGNFGVGTNNPTALFTLNKTTAVGNNPFNAGNILFSVGDVGTVDYTLRTDASGNIYHVNDNGGNQIWYDSGASSLMAILNNGNVVYGNDATTYTVNDNASVIGSPVRTITNNRLHVQGSVQLNSANDAFVVGNGTATFLSTDELGFGSGGGFYMDDTSSVKVRNNKNVSSTGNAYFAQFIDANDDTYYADFGNTDISIMFAGEARGGNGSLGNPTYSFESDGNTGMYRKAADTIGFSAGGNEEMNIYTTYVDVINELRTHKLVDRADTDYSFEPQGVSNGWRLSTPSGYIDFGPMNTSWAHIQTDRSNFFFNKGITVDTGVVASYDEDLQLRRATNNNHRLRITSGRNVSDQTFQVSGGTVTSAPTKLEISSTASTTDPGDMYGQIQFRVPNASGVTASGITGTDINTIAMITAEDYRAGTGKTNEDSGIGFYTTPSTGALQYNGGISSTGAWYVGNLRGEGSRGRLYVQNETYSTRYYDRNNENYYGDFASTSIMNTVRVNRLEVESSGRYIDTPSGEYGSIRVEGSTGGWAGYAIRDDWVFMSDGTTNAGIYNDSRNEWATRWYDNGSTELFFNGVKQLETENGYTLATNQMRAPIFRDSDSTGFFAKFSTNSRFNTLSLGDQAELSTDTTYPLKIHHNNRYLIGLRAAGADANYPWLVHATRNSRSNFIIHFNGVGDRHWFEENGDFQAQGTGRFGNIALNGGNEDIGLIKSYGSGKSDTTLFDATEYWEKRVIQTMTGIENPATTNTAEYVKNNDGPFESTYALRTSGYRTFDSDYIAVEPGMKIYAEIAAKYISGSGGLLYMGVRRYDKDKKPIASNDGITYFVASAANVTSTGWTTYKGHHTIPTSHTVYNGSDGGGCKYIRVIVLMNYSAGGAVREFGPPIVRRTAYLSDITAQQAEFSGNVYAPRYYDSNNGNFYLDPASTSILNIVDASNFRDRDNTARFMNPATGGNVQGTWNWNNGDIDNLNNLSFNDPGPNEGIRWKGGTDWRIYESPDNLTTNSGGNLQFTATTGGAQTYQMRLTNGGSLTARGNMRAPIFEDLNDTTYFINPATTGQAMRLRGWIQLDADDNDVWMDMKSASNGYGRIRMFAQAGDPVIEFSDASNGAGQDQVWALGADDRNTGSMVIRWNGSTLFPRDWTSNGTEFFQLKHNGNLSLSGGEPDSYRLTVGGTAYASTAMRSPIYYDHNAPSYYGDFSGTSQMNALTLAGTLTSNGIHYIDNPQDYDQPIVTQLANAPLSSKNNDVNVGSADAFLPFGHMTARYSAGYRTHLNFGLFKRASLWGDNNTGMYIALGGNDSYPTKFWKLTYGHELYNTEGYVSNPGSFRAPIFYDLNDPNYYGDFASTSRMNTIIANTYSLNDGWDIYDDNGETLSIRSNNSDHGSVIFRDSNSTDCGRIYFDDDSHWGFKSPDNEWQIYLERNARVILYYNGVQQARTQNGYFEANNELRTPIIRDSNDPTNYYLNPNGTSRTLTFRADDAFRSNRFEELGGGFLWRVGNTTTGVDSQRSLNLWDSTGDPSQADGSAATMITWGQRTDNQPYYTIYVDKENYGGDYSKLNLAWHTGIKIGASQSYGGTRFYNNSPFTGSEIFSVGKGDANVRVQNSLYATIMRDLNSASWYVQPAGRSRMNQVQANYYERAAHNTGHLVGSYNNVGENSTRSNPIYTIGSSYNPASSTLGNMYGIGYTNSNASFDPSHASGWGMYVAADGDARVWLGGSDGRVVGTGYFYADRYYDYNGTSYYLDPAGTSILNDVTQDGTLIIKGRQRDSANSRDYIGTGTGYEQLYDALNNTALELWSGNDQPTTIYFRSAVNAPSDFAYIYYDPDYDNTGENGALVLGSENDGTGSSDYIRLQSRTVVDSNLRTTDSETIMDWRFQGSSRGIFERNYLDHVEEMRAPIYRDRNDTNWFIDPAGNSNISTMDFDRLDGPSTSSYDKIRVYDSSSYAIGMVSGITHGDLNDWAMTFTFNDDNDRGFVWRDTAHGVNQAAMSLSTRGRLNVSERLRVGYGQTDTSGPGTAGIEVSGGMYASSEVRGSLFRDSQNSNFYVDPAGVSELATVRVDRLDLRDRGDFITFYGNDNSYHSITSRDSGGGISDDLRFNSYHDIYFNLDTNNNNSSDTTGFYVGQHGTDVGSISGWYWRTMADGISYASGQVYAPLFRDSNSTGYYVDPASTSRMNRIDPNEIYNYGWFRNHQAGEGMYNQTRGTHFYARNSQEWRMTGNARDSEFNLRAMGTYDNTTGSRFWIHGEGASNTASFMQGFLNSGGQWMFRMTHRDGYSPGMWFYEPDVAWTGNIGNDKGKIEYHSDRFYIVAGGNSNRICQFRRDGSDKSYVNNDGIYVGLATSARWADLAERYSADDIYENATVMGINLDGDSEITKWEPGMPLAGVISTNPAVQMNDMGIEPGSTSKEAKMNPFIALKGRIPCKVVGEVRKGQWLVPAGDGKAKGVDYGTPGINSHEIIGIALSNSENGIVEVKV